MMSTALSLGRNTEPAPPGMEDDVELAPPGVDEIVQKSYTVKKDIDGITDQKLQSLKFGDVEFSPQDPICIIDVNKNGQNLHFKCELCDIMVASARVLKTHFDSPAHIRKMKEKRDGELTTGEATIPAQRKRAPEEDQNGHGGKAARMDSSNEQVEAESVLSETLNTHKEPLIGLQYLDETQHPNASNDPTFQCRLCDKAFNIRSVVSHMASFPHRMKYLEKHYPDYHSEVQTNGPNYHLSKQYAEQVDKAEGRHKINVIVDHTVIDKVENSGDDKLSLKSAGSSGNDSPSATSSSQTNAPIPRPQVRPMNPIRAAFNPTSSMPIQMAPPGVVAQNQTPGNFTQRPGPQRQIRPANQMRPMGNFMNEQQVMPSPQSMNAPPGVGGPPGQMDPSGYGWSQGQGMGPPGQMNQMGGQHGQPQGMGPSGHMNQMGGPPPQGMGPPGHVNQMGGPQGQPQMGPPGHMNQMAGPPQMGPPGQMNQMRGPMGGQQNQWGPPGVAPMMGQHGPMGHQMRPPMQQQAPGFNQMQLQAMNPANFVNGPQPGVPTSMPGSTSYQQQHHMMSSVPVAPSPELYGYEYDYWTEYGFSDPHSYNAWYAQNHGGAAAEQSTAAMTSQPADVTFSTPAYIVKSAEMAVPAAVTIKPSAQMQAVLGIKPLESSGIVSTPITTNLPVATSKKKPAKITAASQVPTATPTPAPAPAPEPVHEPAAEPEAWNTTKIMKEILKNADKLILNEEDASLALQASNVLTQALLNYRLKSVPKEVLKNINMAKLLKARK